MQKGGGGRSLLRPPSHAPRNVSIPCALTRLRILPVATGVYRAQIPETAPFFSARSVPASRTRPLFSHTYKSLGGQPLYFHIHANPWGCGVVGPGPQVATVSQTAFDSRQGHDSNPTVPMFDTAGTDAGVRASRSPRVRVLYRS